jgi:hypothetical protein
MIIQEALSQYSAEMHPDSEVRPLLQPKERGKSPTAGRWQIHRNEQNGDKITTELIIHNPDRSLREMGTIDAQIDDGNLASGSLILRDRDTYVLSLFEEASDSNRIKASGEPMDAE